MKWMQTIYNILFFFVRSSSSTSSPLLFLFAYCSPKRGKTKRKITIVTHHKMPFFSFFARRVVCIFTSFSHFFFAVWCNMCLLHAASKSCNTCECEYGSMVGHDGYTLLAHNEFCDADLYCFTNFAQFTFFFIFGWILYVSGTKFYRFLYWLCLCPTW